MPAVKSKYLRFSKSHKYEPSPFTNTGGGLAYVASMNLECSFTKAALAESSDGSGFGREASREMESWTFCDRLDDAVACDDRLRTPAGKSRRTGSRSAMSQSFEASLLGLSYRYCCKE